MSHNYNAAQAPHWERILLYTSSLMARPFCDAWTVLRYRLVAPLDPKKFDNYPSEAQEIAARALILLGVYAGGQVTRKFPITVLSIIAMLGIGSRAFRAIGFAQQKNGYTYVRGDVAEKPIGAEIKIMSWNTCWLPGGLHYEHGGVISGMSRLPGIAVKQCPLLSYKDYNIFMNKLLKKPKMEP